MHKHDYLLKVEELKCPIPTTLMYCSLNLTNNRVSRGIIYITMSSADARPHSFCIERVVSSLTNVCAFDNCTTMYIYYIRSMQHGSYNHLYRDFRSIVCLQFAHAWTFQNFVWSNIQIGGWCCTCVKRYSNDCSLLMIKGTALCCMYLWLLTRALYSLLPCLRCINYNLPHPLHVHIYS